MKNTRFAGWFAISAVMVASSTAFAQFPINIPKLGQPKPTATPVSIARTTSQPVDTSTTTAATTGSTAQPPTAGENPVLLKTTLDIRCDTEARYWKLPTESNYTSWIPMVKFKVLYAGAAKLRLTAEYFTPDGKPWFSETLRPNTSQAVEKTTEIITDRVSGRFEGKSTNATGLFGVKITDTRDGTVLFQGKFKVGKFKYGPNIPMFKNQNDFFVDQDWNLPIGYVWLDWGRDRNAPAPTVSLWLKGENRLDDLEGRLFFNGQQILTTDDMGAVSSRESRYPNSLENKETHRWELYNFEWYKFKYAATPQGRKMFPQARFMNESDGNYTLKVFHKGVQIREVSFKVSGGLFDDNGIASSNGFSDSRYIVPVKIMGDKDKWNPATWKADAFYSNSLTGFVWP